jgi:membrane protease subunit HflK
VDDILTRDVAGFQDAVKLRVIGKVEDQHLGITVDQCTIERNAPRQLRDVFAAVTIASQNRKKMIIDANSYTNRVLSTASAQASTILNQASLASANYVTNVVAEARRFNDLLPQYQSNPELYRQQALMLTWGQVLSTSEKWIQPTSPTGEPTELRLQLNREPPAENPLLEPRTP